MKRLGNLKLHEKNKLSDEELVSLRGGDIFCCYCGFTGGYFGPPKIYAGYSNVEEALQAAYEDCGSLGATCSGESCPS